ncbi:MAG: hypothetical protein WCT77_07695 [Bacteroidota bacterium]|jgi:hypothetical protein
METELLIHDFLDGTLEAGQEESLFMSLSSNDELRSELKQQLAIKQAIKGDTAAFTPAAQSTMQVFSALGFAAPVATAVLPQSFASKLSGTALKYRQGIAGGLIAGAITAALIFSLFPWQKSTDVLVRADASQSGIAKETLLSSSVPLMSSVAQDIDKTPEVRTITKIKYIEVPKYIQVPVASNQPANNETLADNSQPMSPVLNSSKLDESTNNKLKYNYSNTFNRIPGISDAGLFNFKTNEDEPLGFTVEFRGFQQWNLERATIGPNENIKFDNSLFGLYYSLFDNLLFKNDNLTVGAEVRQEKFFQRFTGKGVNGKDYQYEQQPNFTSVNAAFRYYLSRSYWNVTPWAQLTFGGVSSGVIGRAMLGGKYTPYQGISFNAGLEYSKMFYNHQNVGFNSDKLSFNYGVAFAF